MKEFSEDELVGILEERGCVLIDGFEDALVSMTAGEDPVAVYDYVGCIQLVMYLYNVDIEEKDYMDYAAAEKHLWGNIIAPLRMQNRAPIFIEIPSLK
tara:strand:- start:139 stop:432 length:294 start_codon:yes stop_codon:yes gene_type:complete